MTEGRSRLGKTGIEYGDVGFNSLTGCQHNCPWDCWAAQLAKRRGEDFQKATWHPERLGQPFRTRHNADFRSVNPNLKKLFPIGCEGIEATPRDMVLVNFQGDMFGDWVPPPHIAMTIGACGEAPWHHYLFLTKNPGRYSGYQGIIYQESIGNFWLGTSVEDAHSTDRIRQLFEATTALDFLVINRWVSFEPLLGPVITKKILPFIARLDWVVIGALTGKKAQQPLYEWVRDIIMVCNEYDVPYFIKSNLDWPEKHQEFPR